MTTGASPVTVVFGGSFNPPHLAHVLAVVAAQALEDVAEVLVIPAFHHPFGKGLCPYEDRLALCEAAFGGLPKVRISRAEEAIVLARRARGEGDGEGRTVDLLRHLGAQGIGPLRLLVGADILVEAPKWHRWEEVCRLAPPLVLGRVGVEYPDAPPPVLPAVSSTAVRGLLAGDGSDARLRAWVPRKVLAEIAARGLYKGA